MYIKSMLLIVVLGVSACGVVAGPVVVGTTGYLEEVNRGRKFAMARQIEALDDYSAKERDELTKRINR